MAEVKCSVWLVGQSYLTLCDPKDCSLPASSVHGILHARILEWVAMLSSKGSSQPRDQTPVSHIAGGFFTSWATKEAQEILEWVTYPFSRGTSQSRNPTRVSCIAGIFFIYLSHQANTSIKLGRWFLPKERFSCGSTDPVRKFTVPGPGLFHTCWASRNYRSQYRQLRLANRNHG